jgi:hypothetical protein
MGVQPSGKPSLETRMSERLSDEVMSIAWQDLLRHMRVFCIPKCIAIVRSAVGKAIKGLSTMTQFRL